MAQAHSLKEGDKVTHADWPEGFTCTLTGKFTIGQRGFYDPRGKYRVVNVPDERYMQLDEAVSSEGGEEDDYWAEAGLEKVL